jgi:hypothetical protein
MQVLQSEEDEFILAKMLLLRELIPWATSYYDIIVWKTHYQRPKMHDLVGSSFNDIGGS